jgi:hypothetical protein
LLSHSFTALRRSEPYSINRAYKQRCLRKRGNTKTAAFKIAYSLTISQKKAGASWQGRTRGNPAQFPVPTQGHVTRAAPQAGGDAHLLLSKVRAATSAKDNAVRHRQ